MVQFYLQNIDSLIGKPFALCIHITNVTCAVLEHIGKHKAYSLSGSLIGLTGMFLDAQFFIKWALCDDVAMNRWNIGNHEMIAWEENPLLESFSQNTFKSVLKTLNFWNRSPWEAAFASHCDLCRDAINPRSPYQSSWGATSVATAGQSQSGCRQQDQCQAHGLVKKPFGPGKVLANYLAAFE